MSAGSEPRFSSPRFRVVLNVPPRQKRRCCPLSGGHGAFGSPLRGLRLPNRPGLPGVLSALMRQVRAPTSWRCPSKRAPALTSCLDRLLEGFFIGFLSVVTCATSGWASFDRVFGFIAAPRATPPGSLGFRVLLLLRHAPRRRRLSPLRAWPLFIIRVVAAPVIWFGVLKSGCFACRCWALRVADG